MNGRGAKHILCIFVAICLFACGCAQDTPRETWTIDEPFEPMPSLVFDQSGASVVGEEAESSSPREKKQLVPFDQMEYYRPNLKGMEDRLGALAEAILACRDEPGGAPVLLNDAARMWDNYATSLNLAMIHNAIDTTDPYWQEEYAACLAMKGQLSTAMGAVLGAAQTLSQQSAEDEQKSMVDEALYVSLQAQEDALIGEYQTVLNTATVDVQGVPTGYSDNMDYASYAAWIETYAPQLGEIYVQLVKVRNQMARLFGYENYIEYAFEDSSLSPILVSSLLDSLHLYLAPLLQNGYVNTPVEMQIPIDDAITMMRTVFSRIDDGLSESMNVMEAYQLSNLANVPQKAAGAFTGYIKDYGAPFICMRYDESYASFSTLLHEFGHFNDLYVNEAAALEDPETSEIFSTALVLLATNDYPELFGPELGAACRQYELKNLLLTSLSQGVYLSIEMQAYALPEESLSYEQICAIAAQAHQSMGYPPSDLDPISWVQIMRMYDSPFYVLSYILSGDIALQIWEISQNDPVGAAMKYEELLAGAKEEKEFLPNILDCGLVSPFEAGEILHEAQVFCSQLGWPAPS